MTKHLLTTIDFSDCSINALKFAIEISKKLEAKLTVLHAFNIPVTHGEFGAAAIIDGLAQGIEEDVKKQFMELEMIIPELKSVDYNTEIIHSYLVDAVYKFCSKNKVDFIIMGTSGATGLDELLVGSNTYSVIKDINHPVLAIPKNAQFHNLKKIALASDYKSFGPTVLEPLKLICNLYNATLHVIHISENMTITEEKSKIARSLDRYLINTNHHYHLVVNEDFEDGLETYITDNEIDMVAVLPRKRNILERLFGKSASRKIIFHTHIPLLALPST